MPTPSKTPRRININQYGIGTIFLLLATVCIIPANGFTQSLLSTDENLIVSKSDLLNPDLNPRLTDSAPKPDEDGTYPITDDVLGFIHRLNVGGQPILAQRILNRLKNNDAKRGNTTGDSELNQHVQFLHIENAFYQGNYEAVYYESEKLLLQGIAPAFGKKLLYLYAVSVGKTDLPTSLGSDITEKYIPEINDDARTNEVLIYLINGSVSTNDFMNTFFYLEMLKPPVSNHLLKLLHANLVKSDDPFFFERVYNAPEDENVKALLIARYSEVSALRSEDQKFDRLFDIQSQYISGDYAALILNEARTLRDISQNFNPGKIGVLLPFSYKKFSGLVAESLSGLMMALDRQEQKFELIFEDTALNPDVAEKKARKLILEDRVFAIIGPLSRLSSERVAFIADQYKVPVISLSQTPNIGKNHAYFFRMHENKKYKFESMISYITDYMNVSNLNVIYNPTKSNLKKLEIIGNRLSTENAIIDGLYEVDLKRKDFRGIFKSITGKQFYGENKQKKVDYDTALNMDGAIIMLKPAQFLGMSNYFKTYGLNTFNIIVDGWMPELMLVKDIHAQMVFSDSFLRDNDTELNEFYALHWKLMGYEKNYTAPSAYVYYSYHALELLTTALRSGATSHAMLNDMLRNKQYIQSVLPGFTYNNNGEINRRVNIYKINEFKQIVSIF